MNKKTKQARNAGFASMDDWNRSSTNGTKTTKGVCVDSVFGSKENKNRTAKNYPKITKRDDWG